MVDNKAHIPGQELFFGGAKEFPPSVMLLVGPPGSGKTMYCIQFLSEGLAAGFDCAYINCSQGITKERFNSYFIDRQQSAERAPLYLSPYPDQKTETGPSNSERHLSKGVKDAATMPDIQSNCIDFVESIDRKDPSSPLYLVVDSLTNLIAKFSFDEVSRFVANFYDFLKASGGVTCFLTFTGSPGTVGADTLGSLVDGTIQLRLEDSQDEVLRDIRILSLKGIHNTPRWTRFQVEPDGLLEFGDKKGISQGETKCKLCDRPIIGAVLQESGSSFHPNCLDTYKKLGDIYGSYSMYALQPGVVNANFFFIDIVGLSDPLLSVEKQIRKIEDLNALIGLCDAFSKVPNDSKIVLPTGDGMAIGFLVNPELPLQLSMQLHQRLRAFNAKQTPDRVIGVRIGLSSGPVFVVSDINNNQNVWGPGIILARRVMDLGDNGHILLADNIAETLTNLKDDYRAFIKLLSTEYPIKHGKLLRLYSAYSQEFGNSDIPTKIADST